jgi:hypothetical protein
MNQIRRAFVKGSKFQNRSQSTLLAQFNESVAQLPMREAVRYTEKNMKWTAGQVKVSYFSNPPFSLSSYKFLKRDMSMPTLKD